MTDSGRKLLTDDLLRAAAALGWPRVDRDRVGAATLQDSFGPGEAEWRTAVRFLEPGLIRHLRLSMWCNPGLFAPPAAAGSTQAHKAHVERPGWAPTPSGRPR